MAEPWLSTVEKLTEFFSTDQIEASARRTKFVQRASKITGKLFLALITFGCWSTAKTTVPQLAAKAAQLDVPVEITPEALQQRMTARAVAFLQELLQTAFAKLHTGDTICEEGIFAPFSRVHIADSTGFGLPESLAKEFPGAGGSGSKAGAKIQLVWEYKSHTFDHFALIPWNVPDSKYVDTVVELARAAALFLFDLGYFKLTAFAKIVAAQAYFLSRLNHQTTLREVVGGRQQALDLAKSLAHDTCPLVEKAIVLGAYERIPARLIAVRMPEAIVNERRRQAYAAAKKRLHAFAEPISPSWRGISSLPMSPLRSGRPKLWDRLHFKVASGTRVQGLEKWLAFSHADNHHETQHSLLSVRAHAADPPHVRPQFSAAGHRVAAQHRELSLFKLVRHFQASADPWLQQSVSAPTPARRLSLSPVCHS